MIYIESPEEYTDRTKPSLFMAGGITDCPNWQQSMREALVRYDIALLNPRREDFPIHDASAADAQIRWEFRHLRKATAISFWFPKETLNPIVLYELGAWSMRTDKSIFVGVHPEYARRQDVVIQTGLVRPLIAVVFSLEELIGKVKEFFGGREMLP